MACTLCRQWQQSSVDVGEMSSHLDAPRQSPLALVGVYSAKTNFAKRNSVRKTWGRVFREVYGFQVLFFLGALSPEPLLDDDRVRHEMHTFGDVVVLNVPEGYKMNSHKGLKFLEWCALHSTADFIVKVDDDVYLRPPPLVELLRRRSPAGYVWGYFDYQSPVPEEKKLAHFTMMPRPTLSEVSHRTHEGLFGPSRVMLCDELRLLVQEAAFA